MNKLVPPYAAERSSPADVNQGLQPCQQTTESPLLLMASLGKRRHREKVTNGLFAEVGEQLSYLLLSPKAVTRARGLWKPNPLQGWPEVRPQPT